MSLDPHWHSTIFGVIIIIGQALSGLCFAILATAGIGKLEGVKNPSDKLHDLGNLLLALVMFWAYVSFSQFIIIWSGNLKEEIPWYLVRSRGGWQWMAVALALFHFAAPFLVLLLRQAKRNAGPLLKVASFVLFMRIVDLVWTVQPFFETKPVAAFVLSALAVTALGAIWLPSFFYMKENHGTEKR